MPKKSPKQPLPLGHVNPHFIHEWLGRPHSPSQMTARSVHALPHNYATKSPLVTMGRPKFTPKTALPLRRWLPHWYTHPSTDPTHHPKWHLDPISRFATVHFPDRQTDRLTDRQTNRWARWQVCNMSTYALIKSDTLIILLISITYHTTEYHLWQRVHLSKPVVFNSFSTINPLIMFCVDGDHFWARALETKQKTDRWMDHSMLNATPP